MLGKAKEKKPTKTELLLWKQGVTPTFPLIVFPLQRVDCHVPTETCPFVSYSFI